MPEAREKDWQMLSPGPYATIAHELKAAVDKRTMSVKEWAYQPQNKDEEGA